MATKDARRRARGSVQQLPSGAHRVRVYAGYDPVTGRRHYLDEVVPAGPRAAAEAEKARTHLLSQVDERRNPKTRATMNQLLDRYLTVLDVDASTRSAYAGYIRNHIRPALGASSLARIDGEVLDSFYAELRRCRRRCNPRQPGTDHRTAAAHDCDERCRPHACKPLAPATVRQIHWILSGAFDRAVRWKWVTVSPVGSAEPPAPPRPNPRPPNAEEAARIVTEAFEDPDWGTLVWTAMTSGVRRGELCGLRRSHRENGALLVARGIRGSRRTMEEKDTKTHQQRLVALDAATNVLLDELMARQDAGAAALGVKIGPNAFLFSTDPDCSRPAIPDSVTQRYGRMVGKLGIDTTLHKLRHYNATELLQAGVDLRTVAGRLGHGGGGTTTLRSYAAWVDRANAAAADSLALRLPSRPSKTT